MYADGLSISLISKYVGLTEDEVTMIIQTIS